MGSDMRDSYRRDGRDSGPRSASGPSRRRDEWDDDRSSGARPRSSMMRSGDMPSRRGPGGPSGPGSGTIGGPPPGGGYGGSGGRIRRTAAGSPDDGGRSGPSGAVRRSERSDFTSGPRSRAERSGDEFSRSGSRSSRNDPRNEDFTGSRPAGRTMGQRFRDAGRHMSEQLSAVMESVSRAGRSVGRDRAAMSRSMPVAAVPPGGTIGDLAVAPYRRSRSRVLLRKWRSRRRNPNAAAIAISFFVGMLVLSGLLGAGGAGAVYAVSYYQSERGAIANAYVLGTAHSTRILDRNGTVLYAMQRNTGYQFPVPYSHINPLVITATVDTEDRTFWSNYGVDFYGTARAAVSDLGAGSAAQGGSTITQQLVKLLVLQNSEKTFDRKLQEMIIAIGMTKQNGLDPNGYEKWQIMQMYLNNIYYDDQNTGIEAAARNFFGYQEIKDANGNIIEEANQQLTLAQIALLARIPNYPTFYYPLSFSCDSAPCPVSKWNSNGNENNMMIGATKVLDDMVAVGDLTKDKEDETLQQVTNILVNQQIYHWKGLSEGTINSEVATKKAPHFVDYVIDQLINEFGMNDPQTLAQAGLTVYTTLDYNLEYFMEKDAAMYVNGDPKDPLHGFTRYWYCPNYYHNSCDVPPLSQSDNVNNIAAVAIDPHTGDILAMMGSVDYASTNPKVLGFNNMAVLPRSMGSSTKPLVYSTAMQMGWYPGIMLHDVPICFPGRSAQPDGTYATDPAAPACSGYYTPHDYDASSFSGTAPLRYMLANSLNIPATEAQYFVGGNYSVSSRFLSMIGRMGVSTCLDCKQAGYISAARLGPTTALGTQEMPLIQLTGAYGVFADQGEHVPTRAILRIDDNNGNTIYTAPPPQPQQVMSPQTAFMMTSILDDNYARAGDFKVENPLCFTCYPDYLGFGESNNDIQYIAAKTGTAQGTSGPEGIVTMGYSEYMALGVWAGNSDPGDDLNPNIIGITGAGYVFHDVMAWAIKNYHWPARPFPMPDGLTRAQFNCDTGLAPYKGTDPTKFATVGPNQPGTGWCDLSGTGTNLYAGPNAGPYLPDVDWILQGQLPLVS